MKYLIGVDIGTSGTKTVLFDLAGNEVASVSMDYPMYQPQNGWAEQDPADWWDASRKTIKAVIEKSGIDAKDIKGVGLSGQMHGLVMLGADNEVLRNSIIWCDGRTTAECAEITERVGRKRLIEITANPALTGFTAGKILWVRKHEPELYAKCRHILLPKDYVRYMLTGTFATEVSDASGMNLLDVPKRRWSPEIINALGIDDGLLAPVHESHEVAGTVTKRAAELTGLIEGTPVVGGAGDNAAAAVGTGVVASGKAFTTLGTSGVVFAHADDVCIDPGGRVHTFCHAVSGAYVVMSCTLSAGLSLKWFKDNFFTAEKEACQKDGTNIYAMLDSKADNTPIGANRLIFLPYLMGERSPLLDENARGAFVGLSAIHNKYDLLRAVMEGVVYSQRQCLDVLKGMGVVAGEMLACGGGGASAVWRQMLADVYGCPVTTIASSKESPALGAAILAGVGAGEYSSVQSACESVIKTNIPELPDKERGERYEKFYQIFTRLYPALKNEYNELSKL